MYYYAGWSTRAVEAFQTMAACLFTFTGRLVGCSEFADAGFYTCVACFYANVVKS